MAGEHHDFSARLGRPDARRGIERRRDYARSVRAEGGGGHGIGVSHKLGKSLAGRGIPQSRGVVIAGREDARTVSAKGRAIDAVGVAGERCQNRAGLGIPHARRLVP
jgi:hypothetical protein